jgi:S1-C subfamily serine protease
MSRFICSLIILGPTLAWAPQLSGQSVSEVFRRIRDAVVVIQTTKTEYPFLSTAAPVSVKGTGSGVLISPTEILTAAHVVQTANSVLVKFSSGQEIRAEVVASQTTHDVARLRLAEPAPSAPVPMGDSDSAMVGDQVLVVGAPLGESHTLTVGYVSARRTMRGFFAGASEVEFLQTDAAINPGNSGGPMFNMRGEVIGIVSHILTLSGGSMGLGYAVSSNTARAVLSGGRSAWTGLGGTPVVGALAALLNVPPPGGGILVESVAIGSMSESLGLQPSTIPVAFAGEEILIGGDIILSVQGIPVGADLEGLESILQAVADLGSGDTLSVTVLRGGRQVELTARIR